MEIAFRFRRRVSSVNVQGTLSSDVGQLTQLIFL
jgi:hypothetical protein